MRKRILITAVVFILCAGLIRGMDLMDRYEMSIFDYYTYSQKFTPSEKQFLRSRDIQYGIDVEDAPFAFVDYESGQNTGIIVDYFNQLSVAVENNFQSVPYESFHLPIRLKNGDIDAAVLNKTAMNREVFLFTQPLYTERCKILVRGDSDFDSIEDVTGISIGVTAGTTAHHAANNFFEENREVKLILTDSLDESFQLLGMGEVDAIIGDEAKVSYHLNQAIKSNWFKFLEGSLYEEEVAVAVNKNQEELLTILNKGILELKKTNQYDHIHSKWFGSFIPEMDSEPAEGRTANVMILILAVAFVFIVWNQTVKNEVEVKTRELHESREELRNILDNLTDGIIVTDSEDRIQVCNQSILNLLQCGEEELVGADLSRVKTLQPYLEHANDPEALKQGQRYYLVFQRKLDRVSGKNLVFIEDYTKRHQYESLTRQEAKMIAVGELSAGLAHEIRNPLGLIRSYIYIIRKKISDMENLRHPLNVIDDSVDRINNLIENLLGFSRLSVERSSLVNVPQLVRSIVALEHKNLEKNGIEIRQEFSLEHGASMMLNEDVLKLTLVNLMNNSIDALVASGKERKEISIRVYTCGEQLRIDFRDNGVGIEKDVLETVFDPFFTTKETGTGLGLYILNSELRRINGTITAESTAGVETVFHISIPLEMGKEEQDGTE